MNASRAEARIQVTAARSAALVIPSPALSTLVVTGTDRLTWLNGLVTCELATRQVGDAVYGLAVAKNGRVTSDIVVVVDASRVVIVLPREVASVLRAALEHYLIMEDAEIAAEDDAFDVYLAHGPRSGDVLRAARSAGGVGGVVDRSGLGGAVVLAPRERAAEVRAALALEGVVFGDDAGWEALRLERGVPRFGPDFGAKTYPQEALLEKTAVSFSKGCYLGQEVVCMLEMRGQVKRKLVPLVFDEAAPPAPGAKVTDAAGVEVGEVTSAATSPTLDRAVALAMVKRDRTEVGTELHVGGRVARVVERPVP